MTDAELDALEAAAKAATPGPWETDYRQRYVFAANGVNVCEIRGYGELIHMVPECEAVEQMRSNGIYIAAANPAAVLDLIAELRQARAERAWLAAMLSEACARNGSCPFTHWYCGIKQLSCSSACVQDWLDVAKEATCPKN